MEQKINVAELLKDCPTGMELDSTIMENVYFDEVLNNSIKCYYIKNSTKIRSTVYFNKFGEYFGIENGKCVIFPKGKTTWEGFHRPFKDGDIIFTDADCTRIGLGNAWISIFEESRNGGVATYVDYCNDGKDFYTYLDDKGLLCMKEDIMQQRLATEEEKQRLFQAIEDNGYKWNPESKTLEKLTKPEFKVGDEIIKRNSISNSWIVSSIGSEYYGLKLPNGFEGIGVLPVSEQDDWELVHNKLEKLVEPKFKVGDKIRHKITNKNDIYEISKVYDDSYGIVGFTWMIYMKYQDNYELVPKKFDITTLKPFESKVLVRDVNGDNWIGAFYSHYKSELFYVIGNIYYYQCIPYEGNEHLLDTNNDCDEFYKNW